MEGIEILSVGEEIIRSGFNWTAAAIAFIVLGIIGALVYFAEGGIDKTSAIIITLIIGLVFAFPIGFATSPQVGSIPTYKVTIEDSVNFNEFNEKYEIIEQDGKIYTVKERIPDGN